MRRETRHKAGLFCQTAFAALAAGLVLSAASAAAAQDASSAAASAALAAPTSVDELVVTAAGRLEEAQRAVSLVPGGAAIADSKVAEQGRVLTSEDLLRLQPGVFAQAAGSSDAIKMSIRGSGANVGAGYFRSGIYLLFDGMPITGPGGAPYEFFEPLGLSHTEILRGANGFDIGSLTLGGAINYVSLTGRDAPSPLQARIEGGSFGYQKYQLSSGQVLGPLDYYVSITSARREGFQVNSKGSNFGVMGNVGYQISPTAETRFYFRYRRTNNQTPGSLTRAQIDDNPKQANPTSLANQAFRLQPGSYFIGNRTTIRLSDDQELQFGLVWDDYPIDANGSNNRQVWGFSDLSASLDYTRKDLLFGRENVTKVGFISTTHLDAWQDSIVRFRTGNYVNEPVGKVERHALYGGSQNNLHVSTDTSLTDKLGLILGAAAAYIDRSTQVTTSGAVINGVQRDPGPQPATKIRSWSFIPRAGLRYQATPALQLYGNISRSVEPPTSWGILTGDLFLPPTGGGVVNPLAGLNRLGLPLKNQSAVTYEVGGRGSSIFGAWEVSLYYADVKNELLNVLIHDVLPDGTPALTANSNASPTKHQGIEAVLESRLWRSPGGSHTVELRQSLTYSDIRYKHDPTYGDSKLPGLPPFFYQAALTWRHDSGVYVTGSAQAVSSTYVDQANTFSTRPYQIYGLTVGYSPPNQKWDAFVDLRNLTDKHYAATVSTTTNDRGIDQARSTPGDGFGVFGGVTVRY